MEIRRARLPDVVVADLGEPGAGRIVRELLGHGSRTVVLARHPLDRLARELAEDHALVETRAWVEALTAELAPMPPQVGRAGVTIVALKEQLIAAALRHHDSLEAATRCLAVNPRTVARWR
jgi:hypothetical protein